MILNTVVKKIKQVYVPDPIYGDLKLNVMPIIWNGWDVELPKQFAEWNGVVNSMLKHVPVYKDANTHYVTIDSKFFTSDDFLRREGVHLDGNFCADPDFQYSTWGGIPPTSWAGIRLNNGKVECSFAIPYNIEIPIGKYVSDDLGGILCASSKVGCCVWEGRFDGEVLSQGDMNKFSDQLVDERKILFDEHQLYFMTSNTPHESLKIDKGTRRTFVRITLNHNYPNKLILN